MCNICLQNVEKWKHEGAENGKLKKIKFKCLKTVLKVATDNSPLKHF